MIDRDQSARRPFTKEETVALWHAVNNMAILVREMPKVEGVTAEQVEVERGRLLVAKRALRKVNAMRKATAIRSGS